MAENAKALFDDLVTTLKRLLWFPNEWAYRMLALFVMHTYMPRRSDSNPNGIGTTWYVAYVGPKGTGKTTALEITTELSDHGVLSNNISPAALARVASRGHTLFIDELDELRGEAREVAEGVLRAGYRYGTPYIRCEGKDNVPHAYDVFGPKAYSFRGETEDALTSRTYAARMEQPPSPDMLRSMLKANAHRDLRPIVRRLAEWSQGFQIRDLRAETESVFSAPEFDKKLDAIMSRGPVARDLELAVAVLATSTIIGIDMLPDVMEAMSAQSLYESSDVEDFREELYDTWVSMGKPRVSRRRDLRDAMNIIRADKKESTIPRKTFSKLLREVGVRDGFELKKSGGVVKVYFSAELVLSLAPRADAQDEGIIDQKHTLSTKKGHEQGNLVEYLEQSDPHAEKHSLSIFGALDPLTRRNMLETLASKEPFYLKDLVEKAMLLGIAPREVENVVLGWDQKEQRIVHLADGKLRLL